MGSFLFVPPHYVIHSHLQGTFNHVVLCEQRQIMKQENPKNSCTLQHFAELCQEKRTTYRLQIHKLAEGSRDENNQYQRETV